MALNTVLRSVDKNHMVFKKVQTVQIIPQRYSLRIAPFTLIVTSGVFAVMDRAVDLKDARMLVVMETYVTGEEAP